MKVSSRFIRAAAVSAAVYLTGCSAKPPSGDSLELVGAPEDDGTDGRGAESVVVLLPGGALGRIPRRRLLKVRPE